MIQIIVQAQKASCRKSSGERITTGMVGKKVTFDFSAEWDGLVKTAVFEGSGVKKDVTLSGDTAVIPHECLTAPGGMLRVGVFGTDGTIQTPTVYTDIGQIEQGADPSGDTSADPTLPIWAQLQAMMGSLDNLTTTARDNLVAAINEAAKSGGGGAAADVRMQVAGGYIQYSSDGGKSWVNLIALSELIGAPGKTAYDYAVEAGYTGTEAEFSARMAAEIPTVDGTLTQSGQAADAAAVRKELDSLSEEIVTTAESKVSAHNTGTDTHSDIRLLIQGLTDRLNALADSDDATLDQLSEIVAYIKSNRDLISAITTSKVNVADIVDNLTTNVANKPLSAAQGVALKALIDAITIPETLPNPNALTFTGAVTGSYDGSDPLTVNIPSGGGGSSGFRLVRDLTLTESAESVIINSDDDGNPFSLSECFIQIFAKVTEVGKITYIPNQYYVAGTYFSSTTTTAKDYSYDFGAYSVGSEEMFFGYETKTRGAVPQAFYNVERNNNASPYRQKITSYRIDAKFDAGARFLLYGRDA